MYDMVNSNAFNRPERLFLRNFPYEHCIIIGLGMYVLEQLITPRLSQLYHKLHTFNIQSLQPFTYSC